MSTRALLLTALLIGWSGGCRPGGSDSGNSITNGIGVLTTVFEIGDPGPNAEPIILGATAAVRIADTIVVADRDAYALVFLGLDGREIRRVGRQGSGPGEFQSLDWLGACAGDSLYVADVNLRRVTVFSPSGADSRDFSMSGLPGWRWACSRQGGFVMLPYPSRMLGPSQMGRQPAERAPLFRVSPVGDTVTLLPSVQLGEQRPLGPLTHIAMSDQRLWVGTGVSGAIAGYSLDGVPTDSLHLELTPRRVTTALYELAVDQLLGQVRGMSALRPLYISIPMPEFLPRNGPLHAVPDGALWVVTSASVDSVTTLRAFAPDSRVLGDVEFPYRTTVLAAGPDYLITTHQTADGEPRLAMHTIRWRARGR